MNLSFKLVTFREYKNWQQEEVAKELGLSIESYKDIEKGRVKINGIIAQKLSDLYQAPIEFFIIDDAPFYQQAEVIYTNCSFDGALASGYINHNYSDRGIDEIMYLRKEESKTLQAQIEDLQKQNARLHIQNEKLMQLLENKLTNIIS